MGLFLPRCRSREDLFKIQVCFSVSDLYTEVIITVESEHLTIFLCFGRYYTCTCQKLTTEMFQLNLSF